VRTVLGRHGLRPDQEGSVEGSVTVLIRPEQIRIAPASQGGVLGQVIETRYHGHDALILVRPDPRLRVNGAGAKTEPLQVRTIRRDPPAPGEEVSLTVEGTVIAWAASDR
jgi:iron(III) transport system ATP-binding protein